MCTNIKSINELLKFDFFVPSYQRGYRWGKEQVNDLLQDIWNFFNIPNKDEGEFYCLQPIIVKKENNLFRLIDGQQRLTTIYIILSYLDFYMSRYKYDKFTLEYETRKNSKQFLSDIHKIATISSENIDFHYMSQAFLSVKEWFDQYPERKEDFFNTLIKTNITDTINDISNNVRIIWYEIADDEKEIDVFTRINSGKIPLTNAELIKALFLNSKNFTKEELVTKQIEIAKEWDEIEYALQDDEFWMFISSSKDYAARIELIFDIFANQEYEDKYTTYRYFVKQKNIISLWSTNDENIKKIFLTLKYWYEDRELYHLIGLLIATKTIKLKELYKEFVNKTKSDFLNFLHTRIKNTINIHDLDNLEYGSHNQSILRVLLLFNIATILTNKNSYIRFSFDKFNNEQWSLEHIHAQQDQGLQSVEAKKTWLFEIENQIALLKKDNIEDNKIDKLQDRIDEIVQDKKIDDEEFQTIQNEVFALFGESEVDSIDNLALLTTGVNSALSNSIFPIKRNILKAKDSQGEFIPICTKNVFMKYYSTDTTNMHFWSQSDRKDYLEVIKNTLSKFLGIKNDKL